MPTHAQPVGMQLGGERWVERSYRTVGVAVADLLVIAAVIGFGVTRHGGQPVADPWYLIRVVAPFWLGWAFVGTIAGVFAASAHDRVPRAAISTTMGWVGGVLAGSLLRATPWLPGGAPAIFVVVVGGFGLLALLPWRMVVAYT